jgi:hypothetical protein
MAKLKEKRVPYEERLARLEEVTHPRPDAEFLWASFDAFVERHPWASELHVRPKSVAREMVEGWSGFDDYVRLYGLQRSEGLLLRYLGQVWGTLLRSVPDAAKTEEVHDAIAYLRNMVARVDSSLLQEWESLLRPPTAAPEATAPAERAPLDLALTPKAFRARVRAEMRSLVRALANGDWEEAARLVHQARDDPWTPERFEAAVAPFLERYGRVLFDPAARHAHPTEIRPHEARVWRVQQTLPDPEGDGFWCVEGEIDLREARDPDEPLVRILGLHE